MRLEGLDQLPMGWFKNSSRVPGFQSFQVPKFAAACRTMELENHGTLEPWNPRVRQSS